MKKKTNFLWIIIVITLFSVSSCHKENSEDVNQNRIYASYEVFYNANEDKTYARASFRFGNATGTLLELTSPSEVRFNNELLSFKPALVYYEKDFAGMIQSGSFQWKDTDGNSFTNSINFHPINYPANIDTIHRNAAYEFFWQGDSLVANELVTLTINGVLEGDAQIFTQTNINSKSIILAMNRLQLLGEGQGQLWLDRNYSPALTEKTSAGGTINARYRPVNKTVYLK
jgi:hypothetical protein